MQYAAYCRECGMITGHEVHGLNSSCMKCGGVKRTPVIRWGVGFLLFTGMAAFALWIIFQGIVSLLAVL